MKFLKFIGIFVLGVALLFSPLATNTSYAENKARVFTGLTGDTTGTLDKIDIANLTDGDIGFVIVSDILYVYQYHSAATDAQNSPTKIRPNDYVDHGVWYLVALRFTGLDLGASTNPKLEFRDSDATAGDANAEISVDCTDTGNGTEDCDLSIKTQVAGAMTLKILVDADGSVDFQSNPIVTTGTISGKMATVVENTATTWNVTTAQARAGTFFINTNAGTKTFVLPAAEAGQAVCVKNGQGVAQILRVDTDGTDYIVKLTGARTSAAGDYYGATASATNQICLVCFDDTDWYVTSEVGTWTEE